MERKGKKLQKVKYLENEKSFLDEIKNIFHNFFSMLSFGKIYKSRGHQLKYSQGKTLFYSIQPKNDCLAASDLFHMFTQSYRSYIPLSHIKEYRCLKNVIHQIDIKNEWLLLSASFMA